MFYDLSLRFFELIFSKFSKKSKWCLIYMFNCFSWKNILNVVFILNSYFYNFIDFFRCSVYEFRCLICKFIYNLYTLPFFSICFSFCFCSELTLFLMFSLRKHYCFLMMKMVYQILKNNWKRTWLFWRPKR